MMFDFFFLLFFLLFLGRSIFGTCLWLWTQSPVFLTHQVRLGPTHLSPHTHQSSWEQPADISAHLWANNEKKTLKKITLHHVLLDLNPLITKTLFVLILFSSPLPSDTPLIVTNVWCLGPSLFLEKNYWFGFFLLIISVSDQKWIVDLIIFIIH